MQFPRVDRHGHGGGAAARVAGERARGAGRRVRAAAAHARRARPAPGAAQQGQHAVLRALPRRPARHVGRPRCQYTLLYYSMLYGVSIHYVPSNLVDEFFLSNFIFAYLYCKNRSNLRKKFYIFSIIFNV